MSVTVVILLWFTWRNYHSTIFGHVSKVVALVAFHLSTQGFKHVVDFVFCFTSPSWIIISCITFTVVSIPVIFSVIHNLMYTIVTWITDTDLSAFGTKIHSQDRSICPSSQIGSFGFSAGIPFQIDPQVIFRDSRFREFTSRDFRLFLCDLAIPEIMKWVQLSLCQCHPCATTG